MRIEHNALLDWVILVGLVFDMVSMWFYQRQSRRLNQVLKADDKANMESNEHLLGVLSRHNEDMKRRREEMRRMINMVQKGSDLH